MIVPAFCASIAIVLSTVSRPGNLLGARIDIWFADKPRSRERLNTADGGDTHRTMMEVDRHDAQ
jgi:hypothetical protein